MAQLTPKKATICVVNYKTLDLMRLCLGSIRKHTRYPHDVLVVDNDSRDASLDYLRSVNWIRLIERKPTPPDPSPEFSHGAALDLALGECRTEFLVSLHSDTIVLRPNWLTDMIARFSDNVACVGAGKLEPRPAWELLCKRLLDLKALARRLAWDEERHARYRYFNRTVCSVYRTEVLLKERLSFQYHERRRLTVGALLYHSLRARGYRTVAIADRVMKDSVLHLVHATQVINPGLIEIDRRVHRRSRRNIERVLNSPWVKDLLANDAREP